MGMFLIVFSIIGFIALVSWQYSCFKYWLIFGDKLTLNELSTAKVLMAIMVFNIALFSSKYI